MHQGAAIFTGIGLFQLEAPEGDMLANALADVGEFYGVDFMGKGSVWVGLAVAVASVYGKRYMFIRQLQAQAKNQGATVPATPDAATPAGTTRRPYNFSADVPGTMN